jgi:hypothetical protein
MLRISAWLANGYLNSYLRKECGRNCSLTNTYMAKHKTNRFAFLERINGGKE